MEYKICKLSWAPGEYAVLSRTPGAGWVYVVKSTDKSTAEKLYDELLTTL